MIIASLFIWLLVVPVPVPLLVIISLRSPTKVALIIKILPLIIKVLAMMMKAPTASSLTMISPSSMLKGVKGVHYGWRLRLLLTKVRKSYVFIGEARCKLFFEFLD